jgi:hypothetical protein
VIVQESACRVHLAADRLEVMKARIERGMSSARLNCSLPNRSRSALPENRVDIEEAETVTLLRLPFVFVTYWNSSIITIMRITFVAQKVLISMTPGGRRLDFRSTIARAR